MEPSTSFSIFFDSNRLCSLYSFQLPTCKILCGFVPCGDLYSYHNQDIQPFYFFEGRCCAQFVFALAQFLSLRSKTSVCPASLNCVILRMVCEYICTVLTIGFSTQCNDLELHPGCLSQRFILFYCSRVVHRAYGPAFNNSSVQGQLTAFSFGVESKITVNILYSFLV